jgi:hypothetical protein
MRALEETYMMPIQQPHPTIDERSRPVLPTECEALAEYFRGNNGRPEDSCLEYLAARIQQGIETYGQALRTHNGRDAVEDALQESADAVLYLTQALAEEQQREVDESINRRLRLLWAMRQRAVSLFVELMAMVERLGLSKRGRP